MHSAISAAAPRPPGETAAPAASHVASDVARLRRVLLHRPGAELLAVDPNHPERLLFDAGVDLERAQAQHDSFRATLERAGAEVVDLRDALEEALATPAGRDAFIDTALPALQESRRRWLRTLPAARAAEVLVTGRGGHGAPDADGRAGNGITDPLPNLMFTRDPSTWIGAGVVLGRMSTPARRRESRLMAALYRFHPAFSRWPVWTAVLPRPPRVEGGDVLVAGRGRVVVGLSERTTQRGATLLVNALLSSGAAQEVATIRIPPHAGFHLDLVMTMVDNDAVAVWGPVRRALRGHLWKAGRTGITSVSLADPLRAFPAPPRVIEIGSDAPAAHGRPWDHGINVLAIAPGRVVAYHDNVEANAQLEAAGIEVLRFDGSQLAAGRGGPRCLSCPLLRDCEAP